MRDRNEGEEDRDCKGGGDKLGKRGDLSNEQCKGGRKKGEEAQGKEPMAQLVA